MPNEIRNMSQWWNENKIGRESHFRENKGRYEELLD